jgi:hypothetical protein
MCYLLRLIFSPNPIKLSIRSAARALCAWPQHPLSSQPGKHCLRGLRQDMQLPRQGCARVSPTCLLAGCRPQWRQQAEGARKYKHTKTASAMKVTELLAGCWLKDIFDAACLAYISRTRVGPGPTTRSSLSFAALFFGFCYLSTPRDSSNSLDV